MSTEEKIELQVGDRKQSFDKDHAERILRRPWNGGWKLPEDSKYQFDLENGLISRTDTRNTKKSEKARDDSESDQA